MTCCARRSASRPGARPGLLAAITGARVVKTSSNAPEASQGHDAGKRTKGRKQNIATDTMGLLPALVITAASVQDTNGSKQVADQLVAAHPTVTTGWADGGYKNGFLEHAAASGIGSEVVSKKEGQQGSARCPTMPGYPASARSAIFRPAAAAPSQTPSSGQSAGR